MVLKRACLYFFLLSLVSCIYEPDEDDNFHVVDPTAEILPIQIDLDLAGDTIDIYGPVSFKYKISGIDTFRHYPVFFITDDQSQIHQSFAGVLQYFPSIDSGYVALKLRMPLRTKTGSLADRMGLEKVGYERSWVVNVNRLTPKPVSITTMGPHNGSLKVAWQKCFQKNFKAYHLYKTQSNSTALEKVISDRDSAFYIDRKYIGGDITYHVTISTKSNDFSEGSAFDYTDTMPHFVKKESVADSHVKIYWSAANYPANFQGYEVYVSRSPGSNLVYSTTDPNDTTFTFLPNFGEPEYITISTKIKLGEIAPGSAVPTEFVHGEKIERFTRIFFATSANRYYTVRDQKLRAFASDGNQLLAETDFDTNGAFNAYNIPVEISDDEDELMMLDNGRVLKSLDMETLKVKEELDLSSLLNDGELFMGLGITNNNKFLLLKRKPWLGYGYLLIYDRLSNTVDNVYEVIDFGISLSLYHDQKYVLLKGGTGFGAILRLESNNSVTRLYETSSAHLFFNPDVDYQALVGFIEPPGNLENWDFKTPLYLSRTSTPSLRLLDMNHVNSNIIGLLGDETGVVYDYKLQNVRMKFGGLYSINLRLSENYVYASTGVRIKLAP